MVHLRWVNEDVNGSNPFKKLADKCLAEKGPNMLIHFSKVKEKKTLLVFVKRHLSRIFDQRLVL
jgi:hypothetical protein